MCVCVSVFRVPSCSSVWWRCRPSGLRPCRSNHMEDQMRVRQKGREREKETERQTADYPLPKRVSEKGPSVACTRPTAPFARHVQSRQLIREEIVNIIFSPPLALPLTSRVFSLSLSLALLRLLPANVYVKLNGLLFKRGNCYFSFPHDVYF